jgi:predicted Zn-dependent protease
VLRLVDAKSAPARRAAGAQAQVQTGQAGEAAQRLQTWVATQPRDATRLAAAVASLCAQGQQVRAVRADAEARVAQLDYTAALDRFKAAQDLVRKGGAGATTSRRRSSTRARARWNHFFANRRSSADSITTPIAV